MIHVGFGREGSLGRDESAEAVPLHFERPISARRQGTAPREHRPRKGRRRSHRAGAYRALSRG
jgi:hypothetical protein